VDQGGVGIAVSKGDIAGAGQPIKLAQIIGLVPGQAISLAKYAIGFVTQCRKQAGSEYDGKVFKIKKAPAS
jgi:hypothetical protein